MSHALIISDNLNIADSIKRGFYLVGIDSDIKCINQLLGRGILQIQDNQFVVLIVTESLRKSIEEVNILIKSLSFGTRYYLLFEGNFDLRISVWAEQAKWVFKKIGFPNPLQFAIKEISKFERDLSPSEVFVSNINAD